MFTPSYAPCRGFNESLHGLRGVAAAGVLCTHVAFQTGVHPSTLWGGLIARFDFFVAVFFALSAYVLTQADDGVGWRVFYAKRVTRIVPAVTVCVMAAVIVLPANFHSSPGAVLATLTFTQIYLPHALLPGLTHLWSLSVEMVFYLLFPWLTRRPALIIVTAAASLGWAWIPFPTGPNPQLFPPAFTPWFAVGMLAARCQPAVLSVGLERWLRRRWLWWVLALGVAAVAGQEFFGPLGLAHPTPAEFARRVLAGGVFASLLLIPYAWAPGSTILDSRPSRRLGTVSYSLFLWHLPVLEASYHLTGVRPFGGHTLAVLVITAALSYAVAECSYQLIEQPTRGLWRRILR